MGKWSDLPHEIVLQMAECLKYEENWMFTNKELYEAYQSVEYESLFVDLQDTSNRKSTLL